MLSVCTLLSCTFKDSGPADRHLFFYWKLSIHTTQGGSWVKLGWDNVGTVLVP